MTISTTGLSSVEAKHLLIQNGPNAIPRKNTTALTVLGRQFKSSLVYLLIVACITSFIIADYSDGVVIFCILLINTFLGFFQEYRSEKIVEKLSHFIGAYAQIIRDGKPDSVPVSSLVVGDLVVLREGDIIPADMYVVMSEGLSVNEAQLTGESIAVAKTAIVDTTSDTFDRSKTAATLFTGSIVEKGYGHAVVFATGKNTQLGSIATLSNETKKETEYEKSLRSFSTFLVRVVLVFVGALVVLKLGILIVGSHGDIATALSAAQLSTLVLFIIALAVAVVPEALPVIATITLSQGALRLAKKHVVVKRLSSLEDLGNVTLLCTDKTGTITENAMTVKKVDTARHENAGAVESDTRRLLLFFYAANVAPRTHHHRNFENPFSKAFEDYVPEDIKAEARHYHIETELPFDPETRRSYMVLSDFKNAHETKSEKSVKSYLIAIGAPEVLSNDYKEEQGTGLRHIGLSYKEILAHEMTSTASGDPAHFDIAKNNQGLAFLGTVSFEDPLRPTAKPTIDLAKKLGVRIKILSGDSREAVAYVARQVGLAGPNEIIMTGDELESCKKDEHAYEKAILTHDAFARVSPRQKYDIINILKKTERVAYQGDGINDAPALKLSDVAIAVNTASDVAKENSDIILLSKNLEVVVNGIKYGRGIFVNIDKYIKYTMVGNFGNFLALSALYLTSSTLPLLPIQILLTNLLTDIPLISIASDTVGADEILRPTRHNPRELIFISLILGIPTALFELAYVAIMNEKHQSLLVNQTGLYVFFSLQLVIFFSIRNRGRFWKAKQPSNLLIISFISACIVSIAIVYVPLFQSIFSFVSLPIADVAIILVMTAGYFWLLDVVKCAYYRLAEKGR